MTIFVIMLVYGMLLREGSDETLAMSFADASFSARVQAISIADADRRTRPSAVSRSEVADPFHPGLCAGERGKPELGVGAMGIVCRQGDASQLDVDVATRGEGDEE